MEIEKLTYWNPWWEAPAAINELSGRPRSKYKLLVDSIKIREITILTGIRRAGKSTLMYQMISALLDAGTDPKQILFVNLEDKKLVQDSLDNIYLTYREKLNPDKKAYIFFDEVHRREEWEAWIRKKYDTKSNEKFVISGSCSYLLKKEYSTLLTGRNLTFEVFPLSFEEQLGFKEIVLNKKDLQKGLLSEKYKIRLLKTMNEYLYEGGFPEINSKQKEYKMPLLQQYFDDILYKDIVDRYNLNPQKTKDLALFFATYFTSIISLRNVRSSLQLSYDATTNYLSYFKEAFLFFTLDHFSYSFKEQKTLASKVYCIDNGLRNAVSFKFSKDEGKLAENLVMIELLRRKKSAYYWKNKCEVDFVIKNSDNSLTAINVSYTNELDEREIKGLLEFKEGYKSRVKELIILSKDLEQKIKGVKVVPLWKWLLND